jgi:predicted metal-dependent hydrolase
MNRNLSSQQVTFGSETIPFSIEFRDRKNLAITVHPDRSVTVSAPRGHSLEQAVARVYRRRAWIAKQRAFFDRFHPLPVPKRYVSGETHLYLGRQYRLKINRADHADARLCGRYLHVTVPTVADSAATARVVNEWYKSRAALVFQKRLGQCLSSARSLDLSPPKLEIRRMNRRWGSCSKSGRIALNIDLVKTPPYCIEYVIMHELCHLRCLSHGPAFQRLLSRLMPDWARRKERLDAFPM